MKKQANKKFKGYVDDDAVRLHMERVKAYDNLFKTREEMDQDQWFEVKKVVEWDVDVDEFCVFTAFLLVMSVFFIKIASIMGTDGWFLWLIVILGFSINMKMLLGSHRNIKLVARRRL